MATIYEVAARAGVSPATVSRVLNGGRVSEQYERRVRAAAAELDFTPNRAARALRRRHAEVIALIIPDIENPFFTALARGVEDRARAAGYSVVLCNTDEDPDREGTYLDIALAEHMAGVIVAPAGDHTDVTRLTARGCPIVAVDRSPHGVAVDTVTVDNRTGGRAATEALLRRGYRRVACVTGPARVETAQLRAAGWASAMGSAIGPAVGSTAGSAAGSVVGAADERLLRYANYRVDGGRAAMDELLALDEPPDAAFVANNLMAVGALESLRHHGLTPPGFGLAVFGDLSFASLARTGVLVVPLPARELGETAAGMLLARIAGDDSPPRDVELRTAIPANPSEVSP